LKALDRMVEAVEGTDGEGLEGSPISDFDPRFEPSPFLFIYITGSTG
jgi:hypothetical protein